MDFRRLLQGDPLPWRAEGGMMNTEQWFEFLNKLTDEELERVFVGMTVKVIVSRGKIVRVVNNAI